MFSKLKLFIPFAVVITALSGLVYLVAQQDYRMSGNDPQIQLSEDIASKVASGVDSKKIVSATPIEVDKSLAPFVIVYDNLGNIATSNAVLKGKVPDLPAGVLNDTQDKSQTRFTWQPDSGVRIAAVVTRFSGQNSGFVLAGRNMREVEARERMLSIQIAAAWGVTLIATLFAVLIFVPNSKKK
jgi:hypothetical protein